MRLTVYYTQNRLNCCRALESVGMCDELQLSSELTWKTHAMNSRPLEGCALHFLWPPFHVPNLRQSFFSTSLEEPNFSQRSQDQSTMSNSIHREAISKLEYRERNQISAACRQCQFRFTERQDNDFRATESQRNLNILNETNVQDFALLFLLNQNFAIPHFGKLFYDGEFKSRSAIKRGPPPFLWTAARDERSNDAKGPKEVYDNFRGCCCCSHYSREM